MAVVSAFWMAFLLQAGQVPVSAPSYAQTYEVFLRGQLAGTEVVSERTDKNGNLISSSEHDLLVSDGLETKRVAFTTELTLAKGSRAPVRYELRYTSGESHDSCVVTTAGNLLVRTLIRGSRKSEATTTMQPAMVIVESNVYHLYEQLVRKYDVKRGGRQILQAYLPPVGADIPAALTLLGEEDVATPAGMIRARNFKFEFVGLANALLSVDKSGRLIRFANPELELEVIRK
jgi:hypothetical protein